MTAIEQKTMELLREKAFSRRRLLQVGGALVVSLSLPVSASAASRVRRAASSADASQIASWLAIQADNTVLVRTGKVEIGTGVLTGLTQSVAEELDVPLKAIKLISGDTDKTPDGGWTANAQLSGVLNLRKVAAIGRQALLDLAGQRFGVPASQLTVTDGTVSVVGKPSQRVTYAQLVQGQVLNVTIPTKGTLGSFGLSVSANPTLKPVDQYKIIGKSVPRIDIPDKVTGKATFVGDIRLPGMLHARMVRPKTLGSTLVSVDGFGGQRFPTAKVVVKKNLVGVVAETEWEAINAAAALQTTWTDWAGLPGSDHLLEALQAAQAGAKASTSIKVGDAPNALARAAKTVSATYFTALYGHHPIGPGIGVADVRTDGTVHIWTHSSSPANIRANVATYLGIPLEKVTAYWAEGSGQYGRSTFGFEGAEFDAVILSKELGRPVRVQWMRAEDNMFSSKHITTAHDLRASLDASGKIIAWDLDFLATTESDLRSTAAILAGIAPLPAATAPGGWGGEFYYDRVPNVLVQARGLPSLGSDGPSHLGILGNIMRSPGEAPAIWGLEMFMNELAAAAGVNPAEFRLNHLSDQRGIDALKAALNAAGWENRPSPKAGARRTGSQPVTGQGVSLVLRGGGPTLEGILGTTWMAAVAKVTVWPSTGKVTVNEITMSYDCGLEVNPMAIRRCVEGGIVQGTSIALHEEVTFDKSNITSRDWNSYPILTMAETPRINVVLINRLDKGPGGGSEPAIMPALPAIHGAILDATGVVLHRTPFSPKYVKAALKA